MRILVTGGCGYIGSHVVRQLSEAGHEVVVVDNLSTGSPDALVKGEKLIVADLADSEKLDQIFRQHPCTTLMHFAASIVAPESVSDPLKYYGNNTCKTHNLLRACVAHGVERFIFSSSAAVYGIVHQGIASEKNPAQPINPYGLSKLMSEWMLRDVSAAHGMKFVALRYFNVAGADPQARMGQRTPEATHLIKVCCQAALGLRDHVSIFGTDFPTPDGTGVRDYIHVEDLASAHLAALRYLDQGGESDVVNVGYGHGVSVREVIQMVHSVTAVGFEVLEAPPRTGDAAILVAAVEKVGKIFGWEPRFNDLRTIVADAWRWEQRLNHLKRP